MNIDNLDCSMKCTKNAPLTSLLQNFSIKILILKFIIYLVEF